MKNNLKVIFLGDTNVGKTSIINVFNNKKYNTISDPTIGAIFSSKVIEYKKIKYTLEIWDTAGQERFRSMVPLYFKNTNIVVIVFDITSINSFYGAINWYNKFYEENKYLRTNNINEVADNVEFILIGK